MQVKYRGCLLDSLKSHFIVEALVDMIEFCLAISQLIALRVCVCRCGGVHVCACSAGILEPHLSALLWMGFFAALVLVLLMPKPLGILALVAVTILRLIFSVGLEPTLFLLGAFNVSGLKTWWWCLVYWLLFIFGCFLIVIFCRFCCYLDTKREKIHFSS